MDQNSNNPLQRQRQQKFVQGLFEALLIQQQLNNNQIKKLLMDKNSKNHS